jgi:hypothetical protein
MCNVSLLSTSFSPCFLVCVFFFLVFFFLFFLSFNSVAFHVLRCFTPYHKGIHVYWFANMSLLFCSLNAFCAFGFYLHLCTLFTMFLLYTPVFVWLGWWLSVMSMESSCFFFYLCRRRRSRSGSRNRRRSRTRSPK